MYGCMVWFASFFSDLHALNTKNCFKMENGKLVDLKNSVFFEFTNPYFFLLYPHENQTQIVGWHEWNSIHIVTMVSSKCLSVRINLLHSAHYSI